ncbi:MAG: hypothetical protein RJA07_952, partial [Bacteroidota bacterium]
SDETIKKHFYIYASKYVAIITMKQNYLLKTKPLTYSSATHKAWLQTSTSRFFFKMNKLVIYVVIISLSINFCQAQKQGNYWKLGRRGAINFNGGGGKYKVMILVKKY